MIFNIINDFLHQLATVVWIGGMIYTTFILMPSLLQLDPPSRGKLMGAVSKKYASLAWASIVILIVTGLFKTSPSSFEGGLLASNYGMALAAKHIIIAVMIFIGAKIGFVLAPKAAKAGPSPEGAAIQGKMAKLAKINTALGIVVLLLVAILRSV